MAKYSVELVEPCLEINENLDLHEKGWQVQKFGWLFIFGITIAGGLGLFGDGFLSEVHLKSPNSSVQFQRFYRYETEMKILVESKEHIASISFPEEYLKKFRIVRFVPAPYNNNSADNTVTYNFLPAENRIVSIYLIPKTYGKTKGDLKINKKEIFTLNHFIYP